MIHHAFRGARPAPGSGTAAGLLLLRLAAGLGAASHGWGKIFARDMEQFTAVVAHLGFPLPAVFAWACAGTELGGGLLLAAGLVTRVAAGSLLSAMSVAAFLYHAGDPFAAREPALAYWTAAGALLLAGPGRWSLDRLIRARLKARAGARAPGRRWAWLLACAALLPAPPLAAADAIPPAGKGGGGGAQGSVRLGDRPGAGPRGRIRELSGIVVYLEPRGHEPALPAPAGRATVSQRGARFEPLLTVVARGQTVNFPNDDKIDHNVFSFSPPRPFDLGIYPRGELKSVRFDKPGPVLLLCSIHENMSAFIFVAPSSLFAVTDRRGRFAIPGVPVGKYVLYTWHPALPRGVKALEIREIDVTAGRATEVLVDLASARPREAP